MEKKEEKEKKSGILVTILVIALLVVFFFLGYAVGGVKTSEKSMDNVKNQQIDEVKEEEKEGDKAKELTESDVKNQLEKLELITSWFGMKYPFEVKSLSSQEVLGFATMRVRNGDSFSATLVSDYVESFFGKNYSFQHEDVNCFANDGVIYKYDASSQTYTFTGTHGHGGVSGIRNKVYFMNATEKGDTLTINTKILYGGWCGDVCGPVFKFYAKYPFETSIYDVPESDLEQANYDFVYEQKKDLLPITSFVYKKQSDDSFGLDEVKIQ